MFRLLFLAAVVNAVTIKVSDSADCSQGTSYNALNSNTDFRDLNYHGNDESGKIVQFQMSCEKDDGYQLFVWGVGSFGGLDVKDSSGIDGWAYTGYPKYRLSFKKAQDFLTGQAISGVPSYEGQARTSLLCLQCIDCANLKLPDCEVYDPDAYCPNCPAPSRYLGRGIDITTDALSELEKLNKKHVVRPYGSQSLPQGLSKFTTSENTQFEFVTTTTQTGKTESFTSSYELSKSRSVKVSGSGNYGIADVSASLALSSDEQASFSSSKARSEKILSKPVGRIEFKNTREAAHPTYQMWRTLDDIENWCQLRSCNDNDLYQRFVDKFIENFGTHYINKITAGGEVILLTETSACLSASERADAVDASICKSVKGVEGCVEGGASQTETQTSESKMNSYKLKMIGGTPNYDKCKYDKTTGFDCDFSAFQATVNEGNTGLIDIGLKPITDLLEEASETVGRLRSYAPGQWNHVDPAGDKIKGFFKKYVTSQKKENVEGCSGTNSSARTQLSVFALVASWVTVMFM